MFKLNNVTIFTCMHVHIVSDCIVTTDFSTNETANNIRLVKIMLQIISISWVLSGQIKARKNFDESLAIERLANCSSFSN